MYLRRSELERTMRRPFLGVLSSLFLAVTVVPAAADTCGLQKDAPERLILAIQRIQQGDYAAFVGAIEPEGRVPPDSSLELASEMETFARDGFQYCVIATEEVSANAHALFLVFKDGDETDRILYVFFMLARIGDEWLFLKTQVSTDFDEVYQFVK